MQANELPTRTNSSLYYYFLTQVTLLFTGRKKPYVILCKFLFTYSINIDKRNIKYN